MSVCTCSAIFCAVLLELASGLHPSFRSDWEVCQLELVVKSFISIFFSSDPSLEDQLWSRAIYAGSYHLNVSYQVIWKISVVPNDFDLICHKIKINTIWVFCFCYCLRRACLFVLTKTPWWISGTPEAMWEPELSSIWTWVWTLDASGRRRRGSMCSKPMEAF